MYQHPVFCSGNIFITEAFAQDQARKTVALTSEGFDPYSDVQLQQRSPHHYATSATWLQNRAGHRRLALIQSIGLVQISPVGRAVVCMYVFDVFSGKLEVIV